MFWDMPIGMTALQPPIGLPPLPYADGLVYRLAARTQYITTVGAKVSGWADASGNAHHHEQVDNDSYRPTWLADQVHGRPAIHFAATEYLDTAAHPDFAVGLTDSWIWWMVLRRAHYDASVTFLREFSINGINDNHRFRMINNRCYTYWGSDGGQNYNPSDVLPDDAWTVLVIAMDVANTEIVRKVGSNSVDRTNVTTIEGVGASTRKPRVNRNGDFYLAEEGFHHLGAGVEVTDSIVDTVAGYATSEYGIAT